MTITTNATLEPALITDTQVQKRKTTSVKKFELVLPLGNHIGKGSVEITGGSMKRVAVKSTATDMVLNSKMIGPGKQSLNNHGRDEHWPK